MYYYLSFLRPPPHQIPLGNPVCVTPQIANDLRTEQYPDAHDIYYSWCATSTPGILSQKAQAYQITRPVKLTTWRESNAYRELKIPPPQSVKEGQSYCLVLTTRPQGLPQLIDLGNDDGGPFPVFSMPILFSSRSRPSAAKQEQVQRVYRIFIGHDSQAVFRITEQTSFDLDKKVWDSGLGLSSWLSDLVRQPESDDSKLKTQLRSVLTRKNCSIVELGAGTGVVSLALGVLRSELCGEDPTGRIIATDLSSAMPLLEHNISANDSVFTSSHTRPHALVLDWDDERLPLEVTDTESAFDVIVMADVAYNTASFDSLIRTLEQLLRVGDQANGCGQGLVLLGYKERDPAERTLWEMTRAMGVTLQKIGEKAGAGGLPVEIWAGKRTVDLASSES